MAEKQLQFTMRIIGGTSRGRQLDGPSQGTRPTAGRVKAALFNILSERILGARFLDLFAGTGAIGIEALSRGAGRVTFVESDSASVRIVKSNLRRSGYEHLAEVRSMTAIRFLKQPMPEPYDIAFIDPPYHGNEAADVLPLLGRNAIIAANGVVIIEHFHKAPPPVQVDCLILTKSYRYGDTFLSIYTPGGAAQDPL
jgi:16S rRNA (guanine966-N2)-methyltransferase